ncbi:MAG: MFS transporter [Actinomycetota bacterium]|nr:MFS transporter [Actinomycetota bacterium]
MFLLPSLLVGLLLAWLLRGRISRLVELELRFAPLVLTALAVQGVIFSRLGHGIPSDVVVVLHLGSYGALAAFGLANRHVRALVPILFGMILNGVAITANGGRMPASHDALAAAGLVTDGANVTDATHRLGFLGDVFALPAALPLANVFSIGDVLIALGVVGLVVSVALNGTTSVLRPRNVVDAFAERAFRRLALGKLVSLAGDWLTLAALVGWLYDETESLTSVAAILLFRIAPPIAGSGIAAYVIDRVDRRTVFVGVELARGGVVGLVLFGILTGQHAFVFGAVALSGLLAALSDSAVPATIPVLLERRTYAPANAALGVIENVSMAAGSAVAGLAISLVGVVPALVIDIGTFGLAALVFTGLPRGIRSSSGRSPTLVTGLRYVFTRRRLLFLVLSFAAATLATGLANATLPRFLGDGVHLGPGAYGFGFACLAGGLAIGKSFVGFTGVDVRGPRWIGVSLLLMATTFALLASTGHAPTALLFLAVIGFFDGTTDVIFDTVVQQEAEPRYHAALFGASTALFLSTMMLSITLAPLVNEVVRASVVVAISGACVALAGVIAFVGSLRDVAEEGLDPRLAVGASPNEP